MSGSKVTVLDGSMGEELSDRGFSTRSGLWSAYALLHHPDEVLALHRDYLSVGASVITTNTYSTVPSYLDKKGLGDRLHELTTLAAQLARQALADSPEADDGIVAGCLPPLSESYRPDLVPPAHEAKPVYRELIDCMVDSVDVFLAETMSSIDEAMHVAETLREHAKASQIPWLVAFTLDDRDGGKLRSGETVEAAIDAVQAHDPSAILFNCATPDAIEAGLIAAAPHVSCRIGGYPNRFLPPSPEWTLDSDEEILRNGELDVTAFVDWSKRFIGAGATYVGGCCGIGPDYIRALAESLL